MKIDLSPEAMDVVIRALNESPEVLDTLTTAISDLCDEVDRQPRSWPLPAFRWLPEEPPDPSSAFDKLIVAERRSHIESGRFFTRDEAIGFLNRDCRLTVREARAVYAKLPQEMRSKRGFGKVKRLERLRHSI